MKILKRIFIDGLSGMAIGLFATLIIGTILEQAGTIIGGDIGNMIVMVASIAKVLTGAGIGIGVASKLGESTPWKKLFKVVPYPPPVNLLFLV